MQTESIYKKKKIPPGSIEIISLGNSWLGIKREEEGWYLKTFENIEKKEDINISEIGKGDYFQSGESNSIVLAPALQDKPIVFKGSKLVIAPKQRITFFIKIPLVFQVYFSKVQPKNILTEFPCQRLSDTWFGEPDSGEAAFALGSDFYLSFDKIETSEYEAICPITIFNNSEVLLDVQRLIIRVQNLTLYLNKKKAVTSLVKIEYKGKEMISSVDYHFSKNFHGEKQEILAKPRNEESKNLLRINFHFIKNIYRTE